MDRSDSLSDRYNPYIHLNFGEHPGHMVSATEESMKRLFFGERPYAEVLMIKFDSTPVGFAVFFHNFSTFPGKSGLYLENICVGSTVKKGFELLCSLHVSA